MYPRGDLSYDQIPRILKPKIARARGSCGPPRNCIRNGEHRGGGAAPGQRRRRRRRDGPDGRGRGTGRQTQEGHSARPARLRRTVGLRRGPASRVEFLARVCAWELGCRMDTRRVCCADGFPRTGQSSPNPGCTGCRCFIVQCAAPGTPPRPLSPHREHPCMQLTRSPCISRDCVIVYVLSAGAGTVWGGGSSLHSGIEFGRSRTGEGSSGGRKRGVV
jgi:hypothetical protein